MPDITPGSNVALKPATTREELISLLSSASELEHGLACAFMLVAYSLKNDVSEGGLTNEQAASVRTWRRRLISLATDRFVSVVQLSNLLTASGGNPYIQRSRFPLFANAAADDSARTGLALKPFTMATIEELATYEHLNARIVVPGQPDTTTNGDLYQKIEMSIRDLPAQELFIGPPDVQVQSRFLNLDRQPIAVTDQDSALAALALITGTSEDGASETHESIHLPHEYAVLLADAQQAGNDFEPVRPVVTDPRTAVAEPGGESTHLVDALTVEVADLFNGAYDTFLLLLHCFLTRAEETADDLEQLSRAISQLFHSVIRPLGEALTRLPVDSVSLPGRCAGPTFGDEGHVNVAGLSHHAPAWALFEEQLWQLAQTATRLRVTLAMLPEMQEATAALQDLACQFAPAEGSRGVDARLAALKELQNSLPCGIQSTINGPYLLTNAERLTTWLGEDIPTRPQMALCRCGESSTKPFCDGTHARIDFTSQKDAKRIPDRRDTYDGTSVTVFDNRGICAHSGFCTDRVSSVFHAGKEPFVSPNGARMDDIVRAVRACPSGALSYALGGAQSRVEARDQVDQRRPQGIEVSKDGPYRVTGTIPLKDGQGNDEIRNQGASLEHYSLCRCGHSQNKPFCSGMHWYVNFHDPVVPAEHEPTLFEWVGGLPALTRMTRLFYDKYVPQDPLIGPIFANMAPDHPERVAAWLGEVFGGPKNYSGLYGGYSRMISQHIGKGLTEDKRVRWVSSLVQAADEAGVATDPEFRSAFMSYIEWGSRIAVENSTIGARPPMHMPMPHWNWGTAGLPSSRISALAPVAEEVVVPLPGEHDELHFTQHIKPLFRAQDRQSMTWVFDLWAYNDVVKHATAILTRLQQGSMPCDGAWPQEKVEVFRRWMESGTKE